MYWRWRSIPEVADLSEEESHELWRRSLNAPGRPIDMLWAWAASVCVVAPLFGLRRLAADLPVSLVSLLALAYGVIFYCVGRVVALAYLRSVARRLRAEG
jgi:hypothetical protein